MNFLWSQLCRHQSKISSRYQGYWNTRSSSYSIFSFAEQINVIADVQTQFQTLPTRIGDRKVCLFKLIFTFYLRTAGFSTAWKVSIFGVILVRIFPHLDSIRRDTLQFLSILSLNRGKWGPNNSEYGQFLHSVVVILKTKVTHKTWHYI